MAANPNYYYPINTPQTLDVTFVGQCYGRRPYYILHLLENGINVNTYGPGWVPKSDKVSVRQFLIDG